MIITLEGKTQIFIHIPKTGGNSVQSTLIKYGLSEDRLLLAAPFQDGKERFDLCGKHTTHKHMMLWQYIDAESSLGAVQVATCARDPYERLVSFYFSPHRHLIRGESGKFYFKKDIQFNEDEFRLLTKRLVPAAYHVSRSRGKINLKQIKGDIDEEKIRLLRTKYLSEDFYSHFGIALTAQALNTSPYKKLAQAVLKSNELRRFVESTYHNLDNEIFFA